MHPTRQRAYEPSLAQMRHPGGPVQRRAPALEEAQRTHDEGRSVLLVQCIS